MVFKNILNNGSHWRNKSRNICIHQSSIFLQKHRHEQKCQIASNIETKKKTRRLLIKTICNGQIILIPNNVTPIRIPRNFVSLVNLLHTIKTQQIRSNPQKETLIIQKLEEKRTTLYLSGRNRTVTVTFSLDLEKSGPWPDGRLNGGKQTPAKASRPQTSTDLRPRMTMKTGFQAKPKTQKESSDRSSTVLSAVRKVSTVPSQRFSGTRMVKFQIFNIWLKIAFFKPDSPNRGEDGGGGSGRCPHEK